MHHALDIFLKNMSPPLAFYGRRFNVTTVVEAARIAKLHESSLQHTPIRRPQALFNLFQESHTQQQHKNSNVELRATVAEEEIFYGLKKRDAHQIQETVVTEKDSYLAKQNSTVAESNGVQTFNGAVTQAGVEMKEDV